RDPDALWRHRRTHRLPTRARRTTVITAVDTNILIDVFTGDQQFGPLSRDALERCSAQGALVASEVVWAETAAAFPSTETAEAALATLGVEFTALTAGAAVMAGDTW